MQSSPLHQLTMLLLFLVSLGCGSSSRSKDPAADAGATPDAADDAAVVGDDSGAGSIPDGGAVNECDEGGNQFYYIVNVLDLGTNSWVKENIDENAPNNVAPGLNLDGVNNTEDYVGVGQKPCGKRQDFFYPSVEAPTHTGVDNRTSAFLDAVKDLVPFSISERVESAIASGELLLLLRVKNVDTDIENPGDTSYFPTDDECVNIDVLLAVVPPDTELLVDEETGLIAPGQMFDARASSFDDGMAVVQILGAKVADGRLSGGTSTKLPVEIPVTEEDVIALSIENAKVEFDIDATTVSNGLLGGTLDVNDTSAKLAELTEQPENILRAVLGAQADINPNSTGTQCQDVSMALVYSGVAAGWTGMTR